MARSDLEVFDVEPGRFERVLELWRKLETEHPKPRRFRLIDLGGSHDLQRLPHLEVDLAPPAKAAKPRSLVMRLLGGGPVKASRHRLSLEASPIGGRLWAARTTAEGLARELPPPDEALAAREVAVPDHLALATDFRLQGPKGRVRVSSLRLYSQRPEWTGDDLAVAIEAACAVHVIPATGPWRVVYYWEGAGRRRERLNP